MAETDPELVIRAVLDTSGVDQGIESIQKRASEGVAFSGEGRGGRGGGGGGGDFAAKTLERLASTIDQLASGISGGAVRGPSGGGGRISTRLPGVEPYGVQGDFYNVAPRQASEFWTPMGGGVQRESFRRNYEGRGAELERSRHIEDTGAGNLFESAPTLDSPTRRRVAAIRREREVFRRDYGGQGAPLEAFPEIRDNGSGNAFESDAGGLQMGMDRRDVATQARIAGQTWGGRYNSIFRGGTNPLNSNLTFFNRFIAIEGIRTATAVADAYRSQNIHTAQAQGDPATLAMVDLQFRENLAGAAPLGVGKLGQILRDPLGHGNIFDNVGEIDVRTPLQEATLQDRLGASRLAASRTSQALGREADVAQTPQGTRGFAAVEANRQAGLQAADDRAVLRGKDESEGHRSRVAMLRNLYQVRDGTELTKYARDQGNYTAEADAEYASYQNTMRKNDTRSAADHAAVNRAAAGQFTDIVNENAVSIYGMQQGAAMTNRQTDQMIRPTDANAFSTYTALAQRNQARQFAEEQMKTTHDTTRFGLELAGNPGKLGEFNNLAKAEERALHQRNSIDSEQDQRIVKRGIETTNLQYETARNVARAGMERDPSKALYAAEMGAENAARLLPPEFQEAALNAAGAEANLARQNYQDQRNSLGGSLALRERITGTLARATGPGAGGIRRQAAILGIAGGAEEEAQGYLRQYGESGLGFADSARRSGINRIKAYGNEYAESLSAVNVNPFTTNFRTSATGGPSAVLGAVDQAEKALKGNLGRDDVSAGKGDVPTLLQNILDALRGGAFRAGP